MRQKGQLSGCLSEQADAIHSDEASKPKENQRLPAAPDRYHSLRGYTNPSFGTAQSAGFAILRVPEAGDVVAMQVHTSK